MSERGIKGDSEHHEGGMRDFLKIPRIPTNRVCTDDSAPRPRDTERAKREGREETEPLRARARAHDAVPDFDVRA